MKCEKHNVELWHGKCSYCIMEKIIEERDDILRALAGSEKL